MNDVRIDLLPPEIATWLVALMMRTFTRTGSTLPSGSKE